MSANVLGSSGRGRSHFTESPLESQLWAQLESQLADRRGGRTISDKLNTLLAPRPGCVVALARVKQSKVRLADVDLVFRARRHSRRIA